MYLFMKDESTYKAKALKKDRKDLIQYINLQLASLGQPVFNDESDAKNKLSNAKFLSLTEGLISSFRENSRLLTNHLSPVDKRLQAFIDDYLKDVKFDKQIRIPNDTFVLNQPGVAREVSLPANGVKFHNEYLTSYRVKQGILNNPAKDKRTTEVHSTLLKGDCPCHWIKKKCQKLPLPTCWLRLLTQATI
jgi:phosphoenolpyruvate carboxykinase (diphosphate)